MRIVSHYSSTGKQYRIIPSTFPPINFFETIVDAADMDILFEIESITNERLREDIGELFMVSPEDRISGPGASVIMAAFTHIHQPSRFTDGSYGVYYGGLSLETAIRETVFHRERFLRNTREDATLLTMRTYEGEILKPLHDIRSPHYESYHHPAHYEASQSFGREMRDARSWGLLYRSVRHPGGECIAIFRPPAISKPKQTKHLHYTWDGHKITTVTTITPLMSLA